MASCKQCIHKTVCAIYNDSLRETLERGGTMLCQCGEYLPAANVIEIKHGYWKPQPFVPTKGIPTSEAVCSVCGRDAVYKIVDNKYYFEDYCPHCGTKMDGEHNEK